MSDRRTLWPFLGIAAITLVVPARAGAKELEVETAGGPSEPMAATCPAPTSAHGGICVLREDVTLDKTIILPAYTHLNCQGHKLLPNSTGRGDNRDTPLVNEYVASVPEVAILIRSVDGVKVQNCVIGDASIPFDFGIYLLDSKRREDATTRRNQVIHNEVFSRSAGILNLHSDDTLIESNHVVFAIDASSVGIDIVRDSDRVTVRDNIVEAPSLNQRNKVPPVPQEPVPAATNTPRGIRNGPLGSAVFTYVADDGQITQVPITRSMIRSSAEITPALGGCIGVKRCSLKQTQVCASDTDCGTLGPCVSVNKCERDRGISCKDNLDCGLTNSDMTSEWSAEGYLVEGNTVDVPFTYENTTSAGVEIPLVLNSTSTPGAIYRNNLVKAGADGIHFSALASIGIAGICGNSSRYCATDAQCQRLGVAGPCVGARTISNTLFGATDVLVENNLVVGPVEHGVAVSRASKNVVVIGNNIRGATDSGILLRDNALESTTVTRNTISDSRTGISIVQRPGAPVIETPRFWGSLVSLNDFLVDELPLTQVTTRLCNHLPSRLACVTDADCDNSCAGENGDPSTPTRCKRTGRACASDDDCLGTNLVGGKRVTVGSCVDAYSLGPAELSSGEARGNYWGLTCQEGGFRAADSTSVLVQDSHPYGEPVATTDDAMLPAPCK